ncbi:hypothetical protein Smp_091070 [Schistosoma mansoni]|uniref:hypothetical protein n=1 Tax=Schistosoma mansoni TaxID=6183 RepID=UPI0001A62522|nr:hypothetical protein Smp_091070 [Schistosoma mansoni]|eukprot:XP_018654267.1 hypothetical protein Smp_091070 [Schistosoma mansoni]
MERGPLTRSLTINRGQKEPSKYPVIEGPIASGNSLIEAVTKMQMGHRNRSRLPQRPRSKTRNRSQMFRQSGNFVGTARSLMSDQLSAGNHAAGINRL